MAYLGNRKGPRESEILNRLGANYFGCSPAALEEDIAHHQYAESRGEVVPVHVDHKGRPFIEFSSPILGETQCFYLEEHGYLLTGEIKTFSEREQEQWTRRVKENVL